MGLSRGCEFSEDEGEEGDGRGRGKHVAGRDFKSTVGFEGGGRVDKSERVYNPGATGNVTYTCTDFPTYHQSALWLFTDQIKHPVIS